MNCNNCKRKIEENGGIKVYKKSTKYADEDCIAKYVICKKCLNEGEDFAYCSFCGNEVAFHMSDLTPDELLCYCDEHKGEMMNDEEKEAWLDYADYLNDPNH